MRWTAGKTKRALRALVAFGRAHRSSLWLGILATVGIVACRLALPWPLRGVVEVVFPASHTDHAVARYLPGAGDPALWFAGTYALLSFGVGIFELVQRTQLKRFAARAVHDMRGATVRAITESPSQDREGTGELISVVVGDSARIKAGLSGILVHALQNGLLFLAACTVLIVMSPQLGLLFLVAGGLVIAIGFRTAVPVARSEEKQRRKESDYAAALEDGLDYGGSGALLESANEESGKSDSKTTRLIARSSLLVHTLLGLTVGAALWIGAREVASGAMAPGEVFVFIAYAITMHRRLVQVGRQAARGGKVLACTYRLDELLRGAADGGAARPVELVPLRSALELVDVKLGSMRSGQNGSRLKATTLTVTPGSRIAVLGPPGSGKSALLRVLAGREAPESGVIRWDGVDLTAEPEVLRARVGYLPEKPAFQLQRVSALLALTDRARDDARTLELLRSIGVADLVSGFEGAWESKVGSTSVSDGEARALAVAVLVLTNRCPLWIIDSPLEGVRTSAARRRLGAIVHAAGDRTLVVTMSRLIGADLFDRIISLKRGKVRFDGTPSQWKSRKEAA